MVRSYPVGTALGGIALAALLLTGCGTDDDGAAASPSGAPPTAASSAPEPSAEATSEGYVPASREGPAQNVPKPVMPELAKEESRDGAQAFLDYWSDAKWYAYQTGDTSYARKIIDEHCEICVDELDEIEKVYEANAWAVDGRESIILRENSFARSADGIYKPVVVSTYDGIQIIDSGKVVHDEPPKNDPNDTFLVYMDFVEENWVYITAAPMSGSESR